MNERVPFAVMDIPRTLPPTPAQADELFAWIGSAEFLSRAAAVRQALDRDPDALSPREIADRLGMPLQLLLGCAAAWSVATTGQPVLLVATETLQ